MLLKKLQFGSGMWKPARLVMFSAEQPHGEAPSVEQEMKAETIGEKQVALLLESNDVAGKDNPEIKKYLAQVQEKLNSILAKKGARRVSSIPTVDDIQPGVEPKGIEGNVFHGTTESRAYRKVYYELMTLAIDSLAQRQEAQFNAHKEAVCQARAKSMVEQYNNGKKTSEIIKKEDLPRIAAFINEKMGLVFDGTNKEMLSSGGRAKVFSDALKNVNVEQYIDIVGEMEQMQPQEKVKMVQDMFQKAIDGAAGKVNILSTNERYLEVLNSEVAKLWTSGLMDRGGVTAEQINEAAKTVGLSVETFATSSHEAPVILMNDKVAELKKEAPSYEEKRMAERYESMSLEDKMSAATVVVNRAERDAYQSFSNPEEGEENLTEADFIVKFNELLAQYWNEEGLDLSGMKPENVNTVMEKNGFVAKTDGSEAPTILRKGKAAAAPGQRNDEKKQETTPGKEPSEIKDKFEKMSTEDKMKMVAEVRENAFKEAIATIKKGHLPINSSNFIKIMNSYIAKFWEEEGLGQSGLRNSDIVSVFEERGYSIETNGSETPKILDNEKVARNVAFAKYQKEKESHTVEEVAGFEKSDGVKPLTENLRRAYETRNYVQEARLLADYTKRIQEHFENNKNA